METSRGHLRGGEESLTLLVDALRAVANDGSTLSLSLSLFPRGVSLSLWEIP